jgi:hypothetical protein
MASSDVFQNRVLRIFEPKREEVDRRLENFSHYPNSMPQMS